MRKVMVFGSFDVLHDGHRSFFEQARRQGDLLIVIVARDRTYEGLRGYRPVHGERERLRNVADEPLVDEAFLGDPHDPYRVFLQHRPSVVCLGYDQVSFVDGIEERLESYNLRGVRVARLEPYRPEEYKSSLLKKG